MGIRPAVAVVIPHLNRIADTAHCCRSLANQTHAVESILVVDNGSTAHSPQDLAVACPNATTIRLETNRGFAAAVNIGLRHAMANPKVTHCWILNNDTFCPPPTLSHLLAAVESTTDTAVAGCAMMEGHTTHQSTIVPPGKNLLRPWMIPVPAKHNTVPDYLSGACLLLKRKAIEEIGLFDEDFFFFFEDIDYSLRIKQAGWQLSVAPEGLIEHRGSATIRHHSQLQARTYRAGHIRLLKKYTRHPLLLGLPPLIARVLLDAITLNGGAMCGHLI